MYGYCKGYLGSGVPNCKVGVFALGECGCSVGCHSRGQGSGGHETDAQMPVWESLEPRQAGELRHFERVLVYGRVLRVLLPQNGLVGPEEQQQLLRRDFVAEGCLNRAKIWL